MMGVLPQVRGKKAKNIFLVFDPVLQYGLIFEAFDYINMFSI